MTHSHVFCVSGGELPAGVTAEQAAYPGDNGAGACAPPVVFERMCVGRCSCLVCRPSGRRARLSVRMLQRGIVFAGRRVCGGCTFLSAVRRRRRVANASTNTNTYLQIVVLRQVARRRLRWRSSQSSTQSGGRRVCPRCATPEIFWCRRELCCWMHCCL